MHPDGGGKSEAGRRFFLRSRTARGHEALEAALGPLQTRADYARYLRAQHALRVGLEPGVAALFAASDRAPTRLAGALAADLVDLGLVPLLAPPPPALASRQAWLGVAYVLQGASLGAQLLIRRLPALGLSPTLGGRHMALQVEGMAAWRHLLALLEAEPEAAMPAVAEGAEAAFAHALALTRLAGDAPGNAR